MLSGSGLKLDRAQRCLGRVNDQPIAVRHLTEVEAGRVVNLLAPETADMPAVIGPKARRSRDSRMSCRPRSTTSSWGQAFF